MRNISNIKYPDIPESGIQYGALYISIEEFQEFIRVRGCLEIAHIIRILNLESCTHVAQS